MSVNNMHATIIFIFTVTTNQTNKNEWSIRKALENRTNMEDDRVAILEAQLAQAKLIAEEADKKYEEVTFPFRYISAFFCARSKLRKSLLRLSLWLMSWIYRFLAVLTKLNPVS